MRGTLRSRRWPKVYEFACAKWAGLLPLPFSACYAMPGPVVSSVPSKTVMNIEAMTQDALRIIDKSRSPDLPLIVGFSIGTVPATHLAHWIGATLLSICSAAHGADMIWESPAARSVKRAAIKRGYRRCDFAGALNGIDPANNLRGLAAGSCFVAASADPIIPSHQTRHLIDLVRRQVRRPTIAMEKSGHMGTILRTRSHQLAMYDALSADTSCTNRMGSARLSHG
jgi:hypothetical protein